MSGEFWRNSDMDMMIQDIIDIFTKVEGVQLVRLSGLLQRERKICGDSNLPPDALHNILEKLKGNGIINYKYIMTCPHCQEISYQIVEQDISKPKLCDTCKALYNLIDGTTLKRS